MSEQIEERRIREIGKQVGLSKDQMRTESKKNITRFLIGLALGLFANILVELLIF